MTSANGAGSPGKHWNARQLGTQVRIALTKGSELDRVEVMRAVPFAERAAGWLDQHPMLMGLLLTPFGLRRPIFVRFPNEPRPRFGHGRPQQPEIRALLDDNRPRFCERLTGFLGHSDLLAAIPLLGHPDDPGPYWDNGWLPPLDALGLYGFLAETNPRRYIEVGSGNSTKIARRAISDHGLRTRVTSIDPAPRAHVDALCDVTVRAALEDCDLSVFDALDAGDMVFFDGSHLVFMGSDATVFFLEVLPRLRPGVLVHVHDIFWPSDYPPTWRWTHYAEQYLLGAFLIANPERFEIELPTAYVHDDPQLHRLVEPLWDRIGVTREWLPGSFWMRTNAAGPAGHGEVPGAPA